jgi:hypothetical protein
MLKCPIIAYSFYWVYLIFMQAFHLIYMWLHALSVKMNYIVCTKEQFPLRNARTKTMYHM